MEIMVFKRSLVPVVLLSAITAARAVETLVPGGQQSSWEYLDDGKDPGKDWTQKEYNASGWKTGAAPLGFDETVLLTTRVSYGGKEKEKQKPMATYFRHALEVKEPSKMATLLFRLRRDDGAVIYWDGKEVARSNMPDGPISRDTAASDSVPDADEQKIYSFVVPGKEFLTAGTNQIAVEVHQSKPDSSDLIFDLEVLAYAAEEEVPQRDYYGEAVLALQSKNRDAVMARVDRLDSSRKDYPEFIHRVFGLFAPSREGEVPDARYLKLLDKAYESSAGNMDIAYTWVRAHVDARLGLPIKPVKRPLPAAIPDGFRFIADTPRDAPGAVMSRTKLLADVDDLELILENCYAYLERRDVDWRGALDALRSSLTNDIPVSVFQHRVARMLTVFGDPLSTVQNSYVVYKRPRIPALLVMDGGKVAALLPDQTGFLQPGFPYLTGIASRPVVTWLHAAEQVVSQASPQYRRRLALQELTAVDTLARDLCVPHGSLLAEFSSADGNATKKVELKPGLLEKDSFHSSWPLTESQMRGDGLGYLRLPDMQHGEPFISSLNGWMEKFKNTRGLIIDLRGNTGRYQDALQTLLPWFMKPGSPLKVVNVAAYRLPIPLRYPNPAGFLGLDGRGLHPVTSNVWSQEQAGDLQGFLSSWTPEWKLPEGKFTDWHVMALCHESNPAAGYYDKPVIVLMNSTCLNAADLFLGAFKGHPRVTLMGTASGGGGGRTAVYILPHSRTSLTLCQMASFAANGRTYAGHGVEPDICMEAKLDDWIDGRGDSLLQAAVEKLKQP